MTDLNNENKIPVLMVVGAGHSGSTLLDLIFDSHSQIVGVGELAQYQRLKKEDWLCGCGKKLKECEFWQKVFHDVDDNKLRRFCQKTIDFFLKRNYFYADGQGKFNINNYIELTEKVYRNILANSGKKIVFDSSKNPVRAEILLGSSKLNIILLHLVRDGRGVAYSHIKRGKPWFYFMKRWAMNNIMVEMVKLRNRKAKSIFIYYDDFAKEPEKVIKYVLRELGLSFEPAMLNFREKVHHLSAGNYPLMFLKKDNEIKPDREWEKKLPLKDKVLFNLLFGWLNIFYKIKPKKY